MTGKRTGRIPDRVRIQVPRDGGEIPYDPARQRRHLRPPEVIRHIRGGELEPVMPVQRCMIPECESSKLLADSRPAEGRIGHDRLHIRGQRDITVNLSLDILVQLPADAGGRFFAGCEETAKKRGAASSSSSASSGSKTSIVPLCSGSE